MRSRRVIGRERLRCAPVHVALNAMYLDPGRSSGTETYLRGLLPELRKRVEVTVLTTRRGARTIEGAVSLGSDEGERLKRLRAEQLTVDRVARRHGATLIHSLGNTGPVRSRLPHVLSVLDVNWVHERTLPRATTLALKGIVGPAARNACAVCCISEAAARDVGTVLRIPRERIVVTPLGAGRPPEVEPVDPGLGIPEDARVVLNVGVVRWHKNQGALVQALADLPDDVVVVLAGAHEDYADEVRELAARLTVTRRLYMPGYLGDAELEWLWRRADVAAFPTRAEGFGLPLVEAMARGVPVAAHDIPVLREVGGDVPEYFTGDPAPAILRAMEARRDGRARAAQFTWGACAERTIEAYERCASG
jgi:glycosyltransferase involved in cell wall biosynthesis